MGGEEGRERRAGKGEAQTPSASDLLLLSGPAPQTVCPAYEILKTTFQKNLSALLSLPTILQQGLTLRG